MRQVACKSIVTPSAIGTANHQDGLVSNGELAWCEVYGIDYFKQLEEAEADEPIALNAPSPQSTRIPTPYNAYPNYQEEIWSVVFGH